MTHVEKSMLISQFRIFGIVVKNLFFTRAEKSQRLDMNVRVAFVQTSSLEMRLLGQDVDLSQLKRATYPYLIVGG